MKSKGSGAHLIKARDGGEKFTIDINEWYELAEGQPDYLFSYIYEQQSSYVDAIHAANTKLSEYKIQMASLMDEVDSKEKYEKQIAKLNEKLAELGRQLELSKDCNKGWEKYKNQIEKWRNEKRLAEATRSGKDSARIADLNIQVANQKRHIEGLEKKLRVHDGMYDEIADTTEGTVHPLFEYEVFSSWLPEPPALVDGVGVKFANWRYLMEMKFRENSDHFDTPGSRLAYLISCTSGEAQDQLLTRLRSKILKSITDVPDALEYLEMVFHNPELRSTDVHDFRFPGEDPSSFWRLFRAFVWNAVKHELPEEDWSPKLHEFLQWKLEKDIGDFSSYQEGTSKELAKEVFLRLLRQEWDDNAGLMGGKNGRVNGEPVKI